MESLGDFTCYDCRRIFVTIPLLLRHKKQGCPSYHPYSVVITDRFRCGNCPSNPNTLQRLRTHLLMCNVPGPSDATRPPVSFPQSPSVLPASPVAFDYSDSDSEVSELHPAAKTNVCVSNQQIARELSCHLGGIVAESLGYNGMMEETVQFFMARFMGYQQAVQSDCLDSLLTRLSSTGISGCCYGSLLSFVDEHRAIMEAASAPMRTTHSRLSYCVNRGTYIEPQSFYVVGDDCQTRLRVVGSDVPAKPIDEHVVAVPMRKVLQKLFEIPGFLRTALEWGETCRKSEEVNSFIETETWLKQGREREHGNDGSYFFPLHLYYDDFETGNTLGSHAGKHKLGGLYYSLPFLPPRLVSKLNFIMLALVFQSKVRDSVGNKAVFQPIIDELNYLYEHGIQVALETGRTATIKFALGCLVGDNSGLNAMLGFVTSFRALRCCRFCRISKHQYSTSLIEDSTLLRTKTNHLEDIDREDIPSTGVVEPCIWYQLPYFSIDTHVSVDVMHDIFEGIAGYTMKVVLGGLISRFKVFTLAYLNNRIKNFDYGPDSNSRLCAIRSPEAYLFQMRMSASEMRNFLAYFGLMVGHLITIDDHDPPCFNTLPYDEPEDDNFFTFTNLNPTVNRTERSAPVPSTARHQNRNFNHCRPINKKSENIDAADFYKLYLLLDQVITIIHADTVSRVTAFRLKDAVESFLNTYIHLSAKVGDAPDGEDVKAIMAPKFHILTHYVTMMLRHGPLKFLSSMRFESKNKEMKSGLKNTPKSAARKEQYHLNFLLYQNALPQMTNEPCKLFPLDQTEQAELIDALDLNIDDPTVLMTMKHVTTSDGITFLPGYAVGVDYSDEDPEYAKIIKLYMNKNTHELYFKGEDYSTITFSDHYRAFLVQSLGSFSYFNLSTRPFPFPDSIVRGLELYVRSRNYVS